MWDICILFKPLFPKNLGSLQGHREKKPRWSRNEDDRWTYPAYGHSWRMWWLLASATHIPRISASHSLKSLYIRLFWANLDSEKKLFSSSNRVGLSPALCFQPKNPSSSFLSCLTEQRSSIYHQGSLRSKCETQSEPVHWLPCGNFCALSQRRSLTGCLLTWLELTGVSKYIKLGSEGWNYNIVHKI